MLQTFTCLKSYHIIYLLKGYRSGVFINFERLPNKGSNLIDFQFIFKKIILQNTCERLLLPFNPLSASRTKWSNTLKQFVGKLPTNCWSVFNHFVGLALKGLNGYFAISSMHLHELLL